jgi:clan AA aspartic protease (TIGR02281 family)
MTRLSLATAAAVLLVGLTTLAADKPEDVLKTKGIRKVGSGSLALVDETTLTKMLADAIKLKKTAIEAAQALNVGENKAVHAKQLILEKTQQRRQIRAQLEQVKDNVELHNKLVDAHDELGDQITLLETTDFTKEAKPLREAANAARETYVQHVLEMRKLADKIERLYTELPEDAAVKGALEELNQAGGKYALTPSRSFVASQKSLKKLEDAVLSETIPIRSDNDTFHVSTVLNGKYNKELCIDSGASLVSLPFKMAAEIGATPKAADQEITLVLADGREILAKLVTVNSIRVGKFTVEKVECAVMPENLPDSAPILGMSFLKNFSFKIDSDTSKLTMTKIDSPTTPMKGQR